MKAGFILRDAIVGWTKILRGEADWAECFRLTPAGLVTALVLFYAFAFLAMVLSSLQLGVPTLFDFLNLMLVQSLWLMALVAALFGTRAVVRDTGSALPVLVPGIFALIGYVLIGTVVSLIMGPLLPVLWLGVIYLLIRLGRVAGRWTFGVSAAFSVLAVLLLVGLPMTLYMLTAPAVPAV
jgi:hypothetical protein